MTYHRKTLKEIIEEDEERKRQYEKDNTWMQWFMWCWWWYICIGSTPMYHMYGILGFFMHIGIVISWFVIILFFENLGYE